ncbi:MAG: hypothetical protein D6680_06235 [Cyanobacteria bacterium J007]|nr:MAG: hypothetical protein D6680_06235 [Cyanobacteria bacterium J007]
MMFGSDTIDNPLYTLECIEPAQRQIVGETAYALGHLARQGLPVLPGLVISARSLREFLEAYDWVEPLFAELLNSSLHLNLEDPRQLQAIARHIRGELLAAEIPATWLDRLVEEIASLGSPTVKLSPSLHVHGDSDHGALALKASSLLDSYYSPVQPEAIARGILQTWAELFRARNLFYWQRAGIGLQSLDLAILVQSADNAIASGAIAASPQQWQIESTWGLGIALGRDDVFGDRDLVDPETAQIRDRQPGRHRIAYELEPQTPGAECNGQGKIEIVEIERPLTDGERDRSVLDPTQLQGAIRLSQQLREQLGDCFLAQWLLYPARENGSSRFYLSQAYRADASQLPEAPIAAQPSPTPADNGAANEPTQSWQGIGAASGRAIAPAYLWDGDRATHDSIPPGHILVTEAIAPENCAAVSQAAAIVTERGGIASHAAIVARELGIPAVVGVANITRAITSGESLLVDGGSGVVSRQPHPSPDPTDDPPPNLSNSRLESLVYASDRGLSVFEELVPNSTKMLVNLGYGRRVEQLARLPVDGVGLVRSELLACELSQMPSWELSRDRAVGIETFDKIANYLTQLAELFYPRPIFYRSLDLRSRQSAPKPVPASSLSPPYLDNGAATQGESETLGVHGAFSYLIDPALFDLELETLAHLRQQGQRNIHLMLPFVRSVEEFVFCRRRVKRAGLDDGNDFQLWIMAEVPSSIFLVPEYVRAGVQGISIGTNDLTQLLLAADREHPQMAAAFDARHKAVKRAIYQLVSQAKQAGIPCSICGLAPARHPEIVDELVRWGIDSISVEPDAIESTYRAIARAERRLAIDAARQQVSPPQI